jgi:hypothetical protein
MSLSVVRTVVKVRSGCRENVGILLENSPIALVAQLDRAADF